MRSLIIVLSAVLTLMATGPAAAEPGSVLVKSRAGSLVLPGEDKGQASRDTLYTLLSREVQVYAYHGSTRMLPRPYILGQTRFYPPANAWQRPAGPYIESLIQKYALRHGVDPALVRAVMSQESGFNPNAVSPKGAQGLMQLMPDTAAFMGVRNPFDPEQNIAGGVGYLRHCLDCFNNNVPLAVAAYNAGPSRVARSQGVPAIRETQNFVKNVMGTYTGKAAVPQAEPKSPTIPVPRAASRPTLNDRILVTPSRTPAPEAETEKSRPRPRAKIIEVHYPSGRQVVVARPAGNQD